MDMKKNVLAMLLLALVTTVHAQAFKVERTDLDGSDEIKYYLIDTVVASDLNKDQLYSNSLKMISGSFKDSRNVIESKDLDLGEIVYKGFIGSKFVHKIEGKVDKKGRKGKDEFLEDEARLYFKCHLFLKDNKYKVVLTDLKMPITALFDTESTRIHVVPVDEIKEYDLQSKIHQMALSYIKSVASELNKKPMNDF